MYTALVLASAGATAITGRWLAVLATLALVVVLSVKAHVEDVVLQRRFGWEFAIYAARVPAVVPRPWRSHRR
jgi:protein-S-isoprenylcysteine O-methyltransferase Ste14